MPINDTNVSVSELTAEFRAPPQGVSAASNSNVDVDTYDKMAVTGGASGNNNTTSFNDFKNTFGVVGGSYTFSSGANKGASVTTYRGVAGVGALQDVNSGIGNGQTIGNFGLGNSGGTSGEAMETAASFSNGHTCTGVFSAAALLGGQVHVVFAPSTTSSASKWSSVTFRYLGSNSDGTETLGSSSFFPSATTINRSAMTHTYVSGFGANSKDYYTVQWGLGQTISVDPLAPMATRPFVIRFD